MKNKIIRAHLAILLLFSLPMSANALSIGGPPEFPNFNDCESWVGGARNAIQQEMVARTRSINGLSHSNGDYWRASQQITEWHRSALEQASQVLWNCRARARSLQAARDSMRSAALRHERDSSSYAAWSRLSPYAAEAGVAVDRTMTMVERFQTIQSGLRSTADFLRSPSGFVRSRLSELTRPSVDNAYGLAQQLNGRAPVAPIFRQLNAVTLGYLQSLHTEAFSDLDRALQSLTTNPVQVEISARVATLSAARTVYIASLEEQAASLRTLTPVTLSEEVLSLGQLLQQAARERAQEAERARQAAAAERARREAEQQAREAAARQAQQAAQQRAAEEQARIAAAQRRAIEEAERQAAAERRAAEREDAARRAAEAAALGAAVQGLIGTLSGSGRGAYVPPSGGSSGSCPRSAPRTRYSGTEGGC